MTWQSFRERANVWLYDSKERVLGTFQWLTLLVNLSALSVLAIYYGYEHDAETSASLFDVVKFSFGFYVLHYLVRVLYHFHPTTFSKRPGLRVSSWPCCWWKGLATCCGARLPWDRDLPSSCQALATSVRSWSKATCLWPS